MAFARWVFLGAGIYGILTLFPMYFLSDQLAAAFPETPGHPLLFFGFVGVAVVWQLAFLMIGRDVARFRPLMPVAMLEKLAFTVPALLLFLQGRLVFDLFILTLADWAFLVLFGLAYHRSRPTQQPSKG